LQEFLADFAAGKLLAGFSRHVCLIRSLDRNT
jgi:hypothetical protein